MEFQVSPFIANMYMEIFEERALRTVENPQGYGEGMWMIPL